MGFLGQLKSSSTEFLVVEIDQSAHHWHLEPTIGVGCPRSCQGKQTLDNPRGYLASKEKAPGVSAGAWQIHPSGGAWCKADYTARVNLITKALDFVQLGGSKKTGTRDLSRKRRPTGRRISG